MSMYVLLIGEKNSKIIWILTFIIIILFILVPNAFSDLPGTEQIIKESFENGFPPEGWNIENEDSVKKWEIKENAWNNQLFAEDGKYFAFVDQSDGDIINTILVSPWIENNLNPCFEIELFASIAYKENDYDNFIFSIQISQDYGISDKPSWRAIYKYDLTDNSQIIGYWRNINSQIDTSNKLFNKYRIGIKYSGNNTKGFGLDDVTLICHYQNHNSNDISTNNARMDSCGCQIGDPGNHKDTIIIIIYILIITYLIVKVKQKKI